MTSASDLANRISAPIDARIRSAFAGAKEALNRVGAPLERAVKSNPTAIAGAAAAVKTLELAIKVELSSALGLTLTFSSTDGD